ncbi:MAG: beta strand repeat-containing protein, partial [Pirellulales bacterium]
MAADNTRKTSNVIHDLATLKTQVETNTNNIANATSPNDGDIKLSVGTGLALGDGSANASANQEANTQWTINLDPDNVNLSQYLKTVDGVGPNATTGNVDLKSSDDSLKVTPDTTNNTIDLTLNGTIPTVNDKTIGLTQGTGIGISGDNATTNMSANSNQTISLNASLSNLNDVDAAGATLNQALVYNGTQWLPGDVSGGGNGTVKTLDGVGPNTSTGDIDLSSPNGSLTITPDTANHTVKLELNGTIPTVNDGKINMTASNGVKMSSDSANASANQSGNTTFKIEADTDSLNSTLNFAKTTDIGNGSIGIIEGTGINVTGNNATANQSTNSNWTINLNASLSQLTDVSDTAAADKQVLTYNDTDKTWEPSASQTGGVTTLAALDDTDVSTPSDGQVLVWNGTDWQNQNASGGVSNLPISSTDDTVEVYQPILNEGTESEAPHTNHLAFRTGANEKSLSVNGGNVGINKQYTRSHGVSQTALGDRNNYIGWSQQIEIPAAVTPDASGDSQVYGQRVTPLNIVPTNVDLILYDNGQIQTSNGVKSVSVFRVNDDDADAVSMKGFVGTVQERGLLERYNIDITGNAPSRFAGQIQTDIITTKDGAGKTAETDEDPKILLNNSVTSGGVTKKAISLHAGEYNNKPPLIVSQGDGVTPSSTSNMQNGQVLTITNNSPSVSKDDPAFVGVAFRNTGSSPAAMGTFGLRQTYNGDDATAEGDFVFYVRDNTTNGGAPPKEVLSVSNDDIKAADGYEPQTDNSLVTKGWVTTNGASGNLPISSTDDKVTLSDDDGTFQIETGDPKEVRVTVNDAGTKTENLGILTDPVPTVALHVSAELNKKASSAVVATLTTGSRKEDANGAANAYGYYSNHVVKQNVNMDEIIGYDAKGVTSEGSGENRAEVGQYVAYRARSVADGDALAATGFQSNINGSTLGDSYQVDAAGNAPSRFAGQVQTNTITTKVAASGDATHTLSGKTQTFMSDKIELRTHYQLPTTNSNADGRPTWTPEIVPVCVGASAYKEPLTVMKTPGAADDHQSAILIYESSSQSGTGYSIDWIGAAGQLAHEDDLMDRRSASINVVRKATSGDWNMEFYVLDSTPGTSVEGVWRNPLTITAEGQLHASTDYEPNDDNSLVTKGFLSSGSSGAVLPIMALDGEAEISADNLQMQVAYTNNSALEVTPNTDDVFYIRSNGGSREISTVAIFQSQSAKPNRGLHIINDNGDTTRTNGRTIIEQRGNDTAGPIGNNPNATVGVFELNVDGWQHIRMAKGCVIVGEEGTAYSTVKLNLSGSLVSNTQFPFYIETKIQGADSTYDPDTGEGSFRSTYVICSTPKVEANIDDLFHFRAYYASSKQPTKTVRRAEYGFYVDDRLTQSCPKRVGVYSAVAARNDADRNISVRGAAPSEFVGPVQVNTIKEYNGASNGVQALFSGASLTLHQDDADAEFGHFVYNTANGHMATGVKGSYTPGTATVTFRKHLEDGASNTQIVRCDPPVFGDIPKDGDGNPLDPVAISKFGVCVYPDNRGDLVSFVGFDFSKYNNQTIFPDDPAKEFVDVKGFQCSNVWQNATGKVSAFYSGINSSNKNNQTWQVCAAGNAPSYFAGPIKYSSSDLITDDSHLVTKKYTDSRIWKGSQSEYDNLSVYDDDILYCITG